MTHHTLELILILLLASVCAVALFRAFNLPAVLAYLLVGALLGPHALKLVPDNEGGRYLAEFGVVFLMFSIGLEFSLHHLAAMRRMVFGVGSVQVLISIAIAIVLGASFGLSPSASFAIGGALAMSSTALLSKLLADRSELDSDHGRLVMGVLLFQDLAVVVLLILVPTLSRPGGLVGETLLWALIKTVVLFALVLYGGQRLLKPWFYIVAKRRSNELFMLNILLITLGLAWLSERFGLSLALGAFLAGMLISETEYRFRVEEDIKPFRDVLLGLFLVTVGMFLNFTVIVYNFLLVMAVLAVILVTKFLVALFAARAFGATAATALRAGLWLCAGGEFGFVLLTQASNLNLTSEYAIQITVAAMVLSLLVAPLLVQLSDKLVLRFVASEWLMRSMQLTQVASRSMATSKHVIICGYGRSGQYLARFLEQEQITYVALDLDPDRVREAAAAGDAVVYGDAAKRETLVAAGLLRASAIVISFSDVHAALRIMHHIQSFRSDLPIIVRAGDEHEMERLFESGATEVVPEMLETSIMLATYTFALVGLPIQRVMHRMRDLRSQRYSLMGGIFQGEEDLLENAESDSLDARSLRLHAVVLESSAYAIGKTIAEFEFDELGVKVSAIRRRGIRGVDPEPDMEFIEADVVILLGTPESLAVAESCLLQGA